LKRAVLSPGAALFVWLLAIDTNLVLQLSRIRRSNMTRNNKNRKEAAGYDAVTVVNPFESQAGEYA
jgi:hypothetical protein